LIVEQPVERNTAMSGLRKVRIAGIGRLQARRGILGREQHERLQKLEELTLSFVGQRGEAVAGRLRFAAVA
jgi:hypothetical protein